MKSTSVLLLGVILTSILTNGLYLETPEKPLLDRLLHR